MAWHFDTGSSGGSGGTAAMGVSVNSGALVDGVSNSVAHGLVGFTDFNLQALDSNNNIVECQILTPDPAFPTSKFLIQVVGINFPAGLTVNVIGF
jgi:hypothetical protein